MKDEQRRAKRWDLINLLRVFDQDTELLMGHLVDINAQGMKLESLKPIAANQTFRLWVEIVSERVPIEAQSMWSQRKEKSILYKTGFRFVNPSEKTKKNIECLIEVLKLRETKSEPE